jgi:hypothetical protein
MGFRLCWAMCITAGCATSSAGNYSITYRTVGAATETVELNQAAEKAFAAEPTSEAQKRAIARVKVFTDSVPVELELKDNVIGISPGASAALVGSLEITAVWKAPDDEQVLPALQKAAHAAGADLAFCPRNEKPAGHIWRCYLVRTATPAPAPNTTEI